MTQTKVLLGIFKEWFLHGFTHIHKSATCEANGTHARAHAHTTLCAYHQRIHPALVCRHNNGAKHLQSHSILQPTAACNTHRVGSKTAADESVFVQGARIMNVTPLSVALLLVHVEGGSYPHPPTKTKTAVNQSTTMEEITFPKLCHSPSFQPLSLQFQKPRSIFDAAPPPPNPPSRF